MRRIAYRAFTLIELLIVIVVISVLASMMLISARETEYTAEANNIISNLRNLRTAVIMWCMDHPSSFDEYLRTNFPKTADAQFRAEIAQYFERLPKSDKNQDYFKWNNCSYTYGQGKEDKKGWYIQFTLTGKSAEKSAIKDRLVARARSAGLLKSRLSDSPPYDGTGGGDAPWILYYKIF